MRKLASDWGRNLRLIRVVAGRIPAPLQRRSLQTLVFEEVKPSPENSHAFTAFVVHGLLGSGRNWRSFSRSLASALLPAQWRMVMVDLRNHGKSAELEGFLTPHDLDNSARDLANLVKSEGWKWPDVVIGHSLGGKIALQFAQSCANGDYGSNVSLPKQLWVLDSVPGMLSSDDGNGEVERVLNTLQSLPSTIPSRRWLVDHLLELGYSKSLSEWLGTNLNKAGEKWNWAFNLDGAIQMFRSYRENDYWPLLEHPPKGMEIHILRAEESDRWTPDAIQHLGSINLKHFHEDEGKVSVHVLPKAGHWVHVDNSKGLLQVVSTGLASVI